jgi:hypothetical protein
MPATIPVPWCPRSAPCVRVSNVAKHLQEVRWITTQAASKSWRNPEKGTRRSYARQPQLDRTTHSLTRSLAVVCGKDKTIGQDTTSALFKLTKSVTLWSFNTRHPSLRRCIDIIRTNASIAVGDGSVGSDCWRTSSILATDLWCRQDVSDDIIFIILIVIIVFITHKCKYVLYICSII